MIRNIIFLVLTVASLIWIFFAGQTLINFSGNENPERLFGQEDGRVLVVNRASEISLSQVDFYVQPRIAQLVTILIGNQRIDERLIISEKKAHVVIESTQPIDNNRIKELFKGQHLNKITSKKFLWNEFTIVRNKGVMEVYLASEKSSNSSEKWYSFDKKSACSIVQFNNGKPIITDYYQKEGVLSKYCRSPHLTENYISINDKEIFANRIPASISYYQFMECEYAKAHDLVFQESVANRWANMGMVYFEYKSQPFLLMDIERGREPDLYLDKYRNIQSESDRHYKDLALTKNFPNNPKSGFYMRLFEDHALFAENEAALLDLEASLEMGQILSLNANKCDLIFKQTPQKVSFREWSIDKKMALTTYNGSSISVEVKSLNQTITPKPNENTKVGVALNGIGKMILVHPKEDRVYALSESNTLFGLSNGEHRFKTTIADLPKGEIQWANPQYNAIVLTGLNKVHVITEQGKYQEGFPLEIESGISQQVTPFQWKGKSNYLVASNSGYYFWLNENGKIIGKGKTEVNALSATPVIWTSQKRLFFGFHGDGVFAMIEASRNKVLRTFPLPIGTHTANLTNELVFFSLEENTLYKYDQRGEKTKIAQFSNAKWLKSDISSLSYFFVNEGNKIIQFNVSGDIVSTYKVDVNSVDCIHYYESSSKGAILGILDGMSNRFYLFTANGKSIAMDNNMGRIAFGITNFNGKSKLYTLSDKFVIHYELNQ